MLAETDVVQQALIAAAVGAVGALIAGVTAVVKSWFAGRDQRLRASNQLDLATKRSQFVQDWVSAHEHLPLDDEARQRINARAVEELDEAYQEAQIGFARGRSAASVPFSQTVKDQLRELLLLRSGLRWISKLVVVAFYLAVAVTLVGLVPQAAWYAEAVDCREDPTLAKCGPDTGVPSDYIDITVVEALLISAAIVVVLRLLFGACVNWLERRHVDEQPGTEWPAPAEAAT